MAIWQYLFSSSSHQFLTRSLIIPEISCVILEGGSKDSLFGEKVDPFSNLAEFKDIMEKELDSIAVAARNQSEHMNLSGTKASPSKMTISQFQKTFLNIKVIFLVSLIGNVGDMMGLIGGQPLLFNSGGSSKQIFPWSLSENVFLWIPSWNYHHQNFECFNCIKPCSFIRETVPLIFGNVNMLWLVLERFVVFKYLSWVDPSLFSKPGSLYIKEGIWQHCKGIFICQHKPTRVLQLILGGDASFWWLE